ncbi:uncharacterized protein LOC142351682 [Convolutriloba macropyga]|uniref:uncharacterized protein LOC142351682 n=1 Tax=Convolutriloba macropyga TaxID=536237 RepID=UPI003F524F8E
MLLSVSTFDAIVLFEAVQNERQPRNNAFVSAANQHHPNHSGKSANVNKFRAEARAQAASDVTGSMGNPGTAGGGVGGGGSSGGLGLTRASQSYRPVSQISWPSPFPFSLSPTCNNSQASILPSQLTSLFCSRESPPGTRHLFGSSASLSPLFMLAAAQGNSLMSGVVRGNSSGGGLPLDFSGVFGNDNIPGQIQSGLERELSDFLLAKDKQEGKDKSDEMSQKDNLECGNIETVRELETIGKIGREVAQWLNNLAPLTLFNSQDKVKLLSSSLFSLCAVTACQLNSSKEFIEWMKQNGNHSDMKLKTATRTTELPNDSKSSSQVPEEVVRCCQLVFEELMSLCPNFLELAALKSIIVFYPYNSDVSDSGNSGTSSNETKDLCKKLYDQVCIMLLHHCVTNYSTEPIRFCRLLSCAISLKLAPRTSANLLFQKLPIGQELSDIVELSTDQE